MKKRMRKRWKVLIIIGCALVVAFVGFLIYASDYRTLDEEYYWVLESENVNATESLVHFEADSDVGVIFYPGGRVDYLAYAPMSKKLQEQGINVFLVDMPFNMANFAINAADDIMVQNTHITNWYIGGHSLGGVAAGMYASSNADKINGLILVGIYLSSDYDLQNTITINGSNDLRVGQSVDYATNVYVIEGGNHAGFGNYGPNEGDGVATITPDEQQNQAVQLIANFIDERNK